ncbi:hypothetical protein BLNAU_11522 [Blattamonas nauphoetae]|uniref:Uncharacterized protein n=1 Tax=Blattamonas nauphoetae TaxID=2049346 RepID=A0ABQ9XQ58_9EUKA|nr:hypothetical protein BLNAU_11522 [Blattamonas nauphoetae]
MDGEQALIGGRLLPFHNHSLLSHPLNLNQQLPKPRQLRKKKKLLLCMANLNSSGQIHIRIHSMRIGGRKLNKKPKAKNRQLHKAHHHSSPKLLVQLNPMFNEHHHLNLLNEQQKKITQMSVTQKLYTPTDHKKAVAIQIQLNSPLHPISTIRTNHRSNDHLFEKNMFQEEDRPKTLRKTGGNCMPFFVFTSFYHHTFSDSSPTQRSMTQPDKQRTTQQPKFSYTPSSPTDADTTRPESQTGRKRDYPPKSERTHHERAGDHPREDRRERKPQDTRTNDEEDSDGEIVFGSDDHKSPTLVISTDIQQPHQASPITFSFQPPVGTTSTFSYPLILNPNPDRPSLGFTQSGQYNPNAVSVQIDPSGAFFTPQKQESGFHSITLSQSTPSQHSPQQTVSTLHKNQNQPPLLGKGSANQFQAESKTVPSGTRNPPTSHSSANGSSIPALHIPEQKIGDTTDGTPIFTPNIPIFTPTQPAHSSMQGTSNLQLPAASFCPNPRFNENIGRQQQWSNSSERPPLFASPPQPSQSNTL